MALWLFTLQHNFFLRLLRSISSKIRFFKILRHSGHQLCFNLLYIIMITWLWLSFSFKNCAIHLTILYRYNLFVSVIAGKVSTRKGIIIPSVFSFFITSLLATQSNKIKLAENHHMMDDLILDSRSNYFTQCFAPLLLYDYIHCISNILTCSPIV